MSSTFVLEHFIALHSLQFIACQYTLLVNRRHLTPLPHFPFQILSLFSLSEFPQLQLVAAVSCCHTKLLLLRMTIFISLRKSWRKSASVANSAAAYTYLVNFVLSGFSDDFKIRLKLNLLLRLAQIFRGAGLMSTLTMCMCEGGGR